MLLDDGRAAVRIGDPDRPIQLLEPDSGHWSSSGPPPGAVPTYDDAFVSVGRSVFVWGIAVQGGMVQARSTNAAWLWSP